MASFRPRANGSERRDWVEIRNGRKRLELEQIAALSRPPQIACVRDTAQALDRALATEEPELHGEELRSAAHALARLTGQIGVEEILDAVFLGFCIGKSGRKHSLKRFLVRVSVSDGVA